MIYYLNQSPSKTGKGVDHKRSLSPIPMNDQKMGVFGDRIYNAHNSNAKFYVATFGYAKAWTGMDVYDRRIDRYTVHFVFDGAGTFNGEAVSAGQMFFAPQTQKYTIINDETTPLRFAWIAISGTELENQLEILQLPKSPLITTFQHADLIEQIFIDTIYKEHPEHNIELYLLSQLYDVLSLSNINARPEFATSSDRTDSYFSQIMTFINTHYADGIKVTDVANHAHISVPYLRRICAAKAGKPPQELIEEKRLKVARTLLANDNSTIEEIASLIGFVDTATFSKSFKRNCGIAPLAYRKQKNEEKNQQVHKIEQTENN